MLPALSPAGTAVRSEPWLVRACLVGASVMFERDELTLNRTRPMPTLDRFAIGSLVVVLLALLWPPDYDPHYAGFFAPLLGLAVGPAAAGIVGALAPGFVWRLTIAAAIGIAVMAGLRVKYESGVGRPMLTAWVDQLVPRVHACSPTAQH